MSRLRVSDSRNGHVIERCPICRENLVRLDRNSYIASLTSTIRAVHPFCYPEFHVQYQCGILKPDCSICQGVVELRRLRELDARTIRGSLADGGFLPEADGDMNDRQRAIINAYKQVFQKCWLGHINLYDDTRTKSIIWEHDEQSLVYNFGADFVIPAFDEQLLQMIKDRDKAEWSAKEDMERIEAISNKIEELGGEQLVWT